jgi:hypothetical protein
VYDQREIERRSDVLIYTSEFFSNDLEITGPLSLSLYASSSARDTDFMVKLVDVEPSGYARNLAEGAIRARYRHSVSNSEFLKPDEIYKFEIDLIATSHVFLIGHRLRLEITSSNFPRYDRNPNTGDELGVGNRHIAAEQRIFHDAIRPSHLLLPLIPIKS